MSNSYFQFKKFTIHQDRCAMKVTTDGCLFGAWVVREMRGDRNIHAVLDIGTGTGLLSLMYMQKHPDVTIDAIEIDDAAAEQALENVDAFTLKNRINIIHANAVAFHYPHQYDLIISNPPFYENELSSPSSKKNIAHHAGGLLWHQLLTVIRKNLKPGGAFCLLLPYKRNSEVSSLVEDHDLSITKMVLVRQTKDHDYTRIMLKGGLRNESVQEIQMDELLIWDDRQQYTHEFTTLLRDFYLHL